MLSTSSSTDTPRKKSFPVILNLQIDKVQLIGFPKNQALLALHWVVERLEPATGVKYLREHHQPSKRYFENGHEAAIDSSYRGNQL